MRGRAEPSRVGSHRGRAPSRTAASHRGRRRCGPRTRRAPRRAAPRDREQGRHDQRGCGASVHERAFRTRQSIPLRSARCHALPTRATRATPVPSAFARGRSSLAGDVGDLPAIRRPRRHRALERADLVLVAAVRVHHEDLALRSRSSASRSNTIRLPSGDQSGWSSMAGLRVRLTGVLALGAHDPDLRVARATRGVTVGEEHDPLPVGRERGAAIRRVPVLRQAPDVRAVGAHDVDLGLRHARLARADEHDALAVRRPGGIAAAGDEALMAAVLPRHPDLRSPGARAGCACRRSAGRRATRRARARATWASASGAWRSRPRTSSRRGRAPARSA